MEYEVERTGQPVEAVQGTELKGSLAVGHDFHVGGDVTVSGDETVDKDMHVRGWLYAPNIIDFRRRVEEIANELDESLKRWVQSLVDVFNDEIRDWINGEMEGEGLNGSAITRLLEEFGRKFLRKDIEDIAAEIIRFEKGLELGDGSYRIDNYGKAVLDSLKSKDFISGLIDGKGFGLWMKDLNSHLEIDELFVRKVAYFMEVVIKSLKHVGGSIILSPASMKCSDVQDREVDAEGNETVWDFYRCYFKEEDENKSIENEFVVGDFARVQEFNIKEGTCHFTSNSYYWRLVVGVGKDYIDLSKIHCDEGSGMPRAGDDIVQLGNIDNPERQNAIILATYGQDTPSFKAYQHIHTYSLAGCEVTDTSYNAERQRMVQTIFGDFYVGDRNRRNYLEFNQDSGLNIKAKSLSFTTSGGDDTDVEDAFNQRDHAIESLADMSNALGSQLDGKFEIWKGETPDVPTLFNQPALSWVTDADKREHVGDYYITSEGKTYIFCYNPGSDIFYWEPCSDIYLLDSIERLEHIASDGILSKDEKAGERAKWRETQAEYAKVCNSAELVGLTQSSSPEYAGYVTAYDNLAAFITPILNDTGDTDISNGQYLTKWILYSEARVVLEYAITKKAEQNSKDYTDNESIPFQRLNNIAADGILSKDEKATEKEEWLIVQAEYVKIKANADAAGLPSTNSAYSGYVTAYINLKAIMDDVLSEENINRDSSISYATYTVYWVNYYEAKSVIEYAIANYYADNDSIPRQRLDKVADDGILSKEEKISEAKEWAGVKKEYVKVIASADAVSLPSGNGTPRKAYVDAYNALNTLMTACLASMTSDTDISQSGYEAKWVSYYEAKAGIEKAIVAKAEQDSKDYTDNDSIPRQRLDKVGADGWLSKDEKAAEKVEWDSVMAEYTKMCSYADTIGLTSPAGSPYKAYKDAYAALKTFYDVALSAANMNTDTAIDANYKARWVAYYEAKAGLEAAIATKLKDYTDGKFDDAKDYADGQADAVREYAQGQTDDIKGKLTNNPGAYAGLKTIIDSLDDLESWTKMASYTDIAAYTKAYLQQTSDFTFLGNAGLTVQKVNGAWKVTAINGSGLVTQANYAELFSSRMSAEGLVTSAAMGVAISDFVTSDGVTTAISNAYISADHISMTGVATFRSNLGLKQYTYDSQKKIEYTDLSDYLIACTDKCDALEDLAFRKKVSASLCDETLIVGGYIKTSLIDVDSLYVSHLNIKSTTVEGVMENGMIYGRHKTNSHNYVTINMGGGPYIDLIQYNYSSNGPRAKLAAESSQAFLDLYANRQNINSGSGLSIKAHTSGMQFDIYGLPTSKPSIANRLYVKTIDSEKHLMIS